MCLNPELSHRCCPVGTGSVVCLQLRFSGVRELSLVLWGRGRCRLCKMFAVPSRSSRLTGTLGSSSGVPGTLGCTHCRSLAGNWHCQSWAGDGRRGTQAAATSGVAGRQLDHGEEAARGGHCKTQQAGGDVPSNPAVVPLQGAAGGWLRQWELVPRAPMVGYPALAAPPWNRVPHKDVAAWPAGWGLAVCPRTGSALQAAQGWPVLATME